MAVGKDTILSYLDQIAKHLWKGQVHGRAAVMIGSGFSRSATCLNPVSPSPPLWSDLAKGLRSDLSPGLAVDGCENPLQLASRFEARFGRQALHSRIRELTGDLQYEPAVGGCLHNQLRYVARADSEALGATAPLRGCPDSGRSGGLVPTAYCQASRFVSGPHSPYHHRRRLPPLSSRPRALCQHGSAEHHGERIRPPGLLGR